MKVELIDSMGNDLSVVNAARVSFSKASQWEYDKKAGVTVLSVRDKALIHYLAKHNHWTPFGHCFASFRIKAPIFVTRQLGKHQVGLVWNEVSRRYVDDDPEFYVPDVWRKRADNVKQGSSDEADGFDGHFVTWSQHWSDVDEYHKDALRLYKTMLAEGVAPEMARMVLPQSMMTEWIWSGSLAAFFRICKLRLDSHTQYETRVIAEQIAVHMKELFPVSWEALNV